MTWLPTTLLAIIALGAMVGLGALLVWWGLQERAEQRVVTGDSQLLVRLKTLGTRLPIAAGVGLLALVLTRWPVMAVAVGLLAFFAPLLFGGVRAERQAIARLEGLANWTESLRDTIAGAVGLEQAIPATAYAASPSIAPQLQVLADRLRVRTPLPIALQELADDLDDPSADIIVAALLLNSQLRGPGLREVLTSLAGSAREELEMRRRITAGRASTRRSVQIVVGVSVSFVLGLALFNGQYVEPYDTAVGQLVLVVVVGLFAAGFLWMRRLSDFQMPDRFLLGKAEVRR